MTGINLQMMHSFSESYGFNPMGVYCLRTGKEVGSLYSHEFNEVCDQVSDIADLRLRVLASMRPSLKWNRLRVESLDQMRKSHPVETMAYLLGLLFTEPKESQRKVDWQQRHQDQILLFAKLATFHESMTETPHSAWQTVMMNLLELEAKLQLIAQLAPFTCADILAMPTDSIMVDLLAVLAPWHARRMQNYLDMLDRAEMHVTNPMARRAFLNTFAEQEPSQAKVAQAAKQQDLNMMTALLDELMGQGSLKPAAQRPDSELLVPVKSGPLKSAKMPARFGIKSNG